MLDTSINALSWETNPDELLKIGRAKYEKDILPNIPHVKKGMMVALDIASGDYEIDFHSVDARTRLERRRPDAVIHYERVGYSAPFRTGYMSARRFGDD